MANVLFKLLTAAQWEALETKDNGTIYRVQKTGGGEDFYQGSNKLNNAAEITAAVAALDGSATIASVSEGVVTLKAGITEADGVVSNNSDTDITLAKVATTGAATDVSYSATIGGTAVTSVSDALAALASASAGGVDSKTVYITETAGTSNDAFSKRYGIYQGSTGTTSSPTAGEKLLDIDIPKDMVVESGSVVTITYDDGTLYDGLTDVTTAIVGSSGTATSANAGKYIKLVIANSSSTALYIAVASLVDLYTAESNATQVQLTIDANNEISATIVAGSVDTTELADEAVTTAKIDDEAVTTAKIDDEAVTSDKIADGAVGSDQLDSSVTASLALADSAVQSVTESDATTGTNGTITVDGTEVAVKGLGTAAYTAASNYDPAGSAANVLGTSSDTASSNTVYGAKAYAADLLTWQTVPTE